MGVFGPAVCVGFVLGGTCAFILVGRDEFFSLYWAGLCEEVCFGVFADDQVYVVILLVVGVRHPAQDAASSWVMLGLG